MSTTNTFFIKNWAAWAPGLETKEDWLSTPSINDAITMSDQAPDVRYIPLMLRRRLSNLGRMVMHTVYAVDSKPQMPLIFSSRYGESVQTLKLLQELCSQDPLSPTLFSTSVHNGLAGLLSIASKNIQAHTAISAGQASFCNGLLEASSQLEQSVSREGVLFVHYDQLLPEIYDQSRDPTSKPLALALHLQNEGEQGYTLSMKKACAQATNEDAAVRFISHFIAKKKSWHWSDGRTEWIWSHVT